MAKKASKSRVIDRALIVGISGYSPPVTPLPAVANDVREMAKLLTSKNGAFQKDSVTTLADKAATQDAILDGCKSRRVFLWMDFCHSGGILARGSQGDAITALRQTLQVVQTLISAAVMGKIDVTKEAAS